MNNNYYIGIDGGGTKTAFGLFDEEGHCLDNLTLPTCHFLQVGIEGCVTVLKEGIDILLQDKTYDSVVIGIGIAGYGSDEKICHRLQIAIDKTLDNYPHIITNDAHISLLGASNNQDRILVIGGTGSIAYVQTASSFHRVGGWGYQLGDEGSAYWIGKQLLTEFCRQVDGICVKNEIYYAIIEKFQIKNPYEIINIVHEMKNKRTEIAQLSLLCNQLANQGNQYCKNLLKKAGRILFNYVLYLSNKYKVYEVSYSGSLFKSHYVKQQFLECLQDAHIQIKEAYGDALYGAYLFARYFSKD